jgi:D-3-phosphoglycerate dehydrogenase / 2-oxoglutarate reductase
METNQQIIAIIPARGGSKGIPRKNIIDFAGKPLIAWSIEAAKKSNLISRVIVTTDDLEIGQVAKQYGAEVPFLRPSQLAQDDTPPGPVLQHALQFLLEKENLRPEIIVWLEPPCPDRTPEEIDQAIRMLQADPHADSLRSVCEPFQNPYKSWTLEGAYLQPLIKKDGVALHTGPRQKTGKVYWQNGAIYLIKYDTIMKKGNFFGDNILPYVMADDRFIDIDKKEDLERAEYAFKKNSQPRAKKQYQILNTLGNTFAPKAREILNQLGDVDYRNVTQEEFSGIVENYDIVVAGLTPVFNKEILDKAKKLKIIAIPATSLENVDVEYAANKGVAVISLMGEREFLDTITGVAELAVGLMIDLMRFTPWSFDSVKRNEWLRENFRGHNVYKKTIGIVGMGRLGTLMAKYCRAFNMDVVFYDPYVEKSLVADCKKVTFDELLSQSDIISIHATLTKETHHMFNGNAFSKMKAGVYIINTARGQLIDEPVLLGALMAGNIAGFAADVLADELAFDGRGFKEYPLVDYAKTHENVIIVPHTGGMTHESRENTDVFIASKLQKVISKS